jgi:cytochrome c553
MKRILSVIVCFIALILMSFAVTKDEPTYKNLKVLPKNINKKQMDSVMHHFASSLGVKCNYCHQYNAEQKAMDFASDANEKKGVARNMLKMMQKLNKKYFDVNDSKNLTAKLEITCYSCHNGKANPATQPPPPRPQTDSARKQ